MNRNDLTRILEQARTDSRGVPSENRLVESPALDKAFKPTKQKPKLSRPSLLNKADSFTSAAKVRELGLYLYFRTISSAQDTEVVINSKTVLMLGSNSYLGLTNHPKVKEAAKAAIEKDGTGCAGRRFLTAPSTFTWNCQKRWLGWSIKRPCSSTAPDSR